MVPVFNCFQEILEQYCSYLHCFQEMLKQSCSYLHGPPARFVWDSKASMERLLKGKKELTRADLSL